MGYRISIHGWRYGLPFAKYRRLQDEVKQMKGELHDLSIKKVEQQERTLKNLEEANKAIQELRQRVERQDARSTFPLS